MIERLPRVRGDEEIKVHITGMVEKINEIIDAVNAIEGKLNLIVPIVYTDTGEVKWVKR